MSRFVKINHATGSEWINAERVTRVNISPVDPRTVTIHYGQPTPFAANGYADLAAAQVVVDAIIGTAQEVG